jgi:hypothetical protein
MKPSGTQNAMSAPNRSMICPDKALEIAPPNGIPATTHVKVSVIWSAGTAPSATPYAFITKGATANPLKNNATANHTKECAKSIGIESKVNASKNSRNRDALGSFHLIAPFMIAAIPLPNAQMANRIPDLLS